MAKTVLVASEKREVRFVFVADCRSRRLSETQRGHVECMASGPLDLAFLPIGFPRGEFLSATRTGRASVLDLDQPFHDALEMKGVGALGIAGPHHRVARLVSPQANGTAIGHRLWVRRWLGSIAGS